jgi:hypothetical protein
LTYVNKLSVSNFIIRVLSDIRGVVRYNGMHNHSIPLHNVYYDQLSNSSNLHYVHVHIK